jgi:hypothetical protein
LENEDIKFLGELGVIQKLEFKPDDVIVLTTDQLISDATAQRIKSIMVEKFEGHKVIVLGNGMKIGVMSPQS